MGTNLKAAWRDQAECDIRSITDPELASAWLSKDHPRCEDILDICKAVCPVSAECLRDAVSDPDASGWRAGHFFDFGVVKRAAAKVIFEATGMRPNTSQRRRTKELSAG